MNGKSGGGDFEGGRDVEENMSKSLGLCHPEHPRIRVDEDMILEVTALKLLTFFLLQAEDERNYHIFYQLCAAASLPEFKELSLSKGVGMCPPSGVDCSGSGDVWGSEGRKGGLLKALHHGFSSQPCLSWVHPLDLFELHCPIYKIGLTGPRLRACHRKCLTGEEADGETVFGKAKKISMGNYF